MKKLFASLAVFALVACGTDSLTTSTPPPEAPVVQSAPAPEATPAAVTPDTGHTYEATLKDNGEFSIKNIGKIPRTFYAYSYKVWKGGEQTLIDKQFTTVQPGDTFSGQLAVAKCETQLDLSGSDTPTGKINGGEIAHKIVKRGTPCVQDCELSDWSDFDKEEGCTGEVCQYRTIITKPAYGGEQCGELKRCKKFDNTVKPSLSMSCKLWGFNKVKCTAYASLDSKFTWDADYDPLFNESTYGQCKPKDTEEFKIYDWNWWQGAVKLAGVTVKASPCQKCGVPATVTVRELSE